MSDLEIKQKHVEHTPEHINGIIKEIEPNGLDDNTLWAYRTLLTIPVVGPFMNQIDVFLKVEKFWNIDSPQVRTYLRRAINNRILRYGKNHQEQYLCPDIYDGEDCIGIALGVNILQGLMKRVKSNQPASEVSNAQS